MRHIAATFRALLALLALEDGRTRIWVGLATAITIAGGGFIYYQQQQGGAASCAPGEGNAFASPGSCGYPDPAYGNVGVPNGTNLTNSGGFTVTQDGETIDALNVTGGAGSGGQIITVNADNVTIKNSRITMTSQGCGVSTCGNSLIKLNGTNLTISHVELTSDSSITVEHAVRDENGGTVSMDHVYQHGDVDSLVWCGNGGDCSITDTYSFIHLAMPGTNPPDCGGGTGCDHLENIYGDEATVTSDHNTLINDEPQTANVFVQVNNGQEPGIPCNTHLTLTDNLFAGGGYTIYACAHATGQGSSTATVTGNRFARCATSEVDGGDGTWVCQDGPDEWGYFPRPGVFGASNSTYGNIVWSGNYWNDNPSGGADYFCEDRSPGCAS